MKLDGLSVERAVVCGGGYSGQAIVRTLRRLGVSQVRVTDSRPAEDPVVQGSRRVFDDLGAGLVAGGHDLATLKGADLIIVSPGVPWAEPALAAARAAGQPVWGEIEFASKLTSARLIGVTGTKGKSTTCALAAKMLDAPLTNSEAYTPRGIPLVELVVDNPSADPIVVEVTSYQLEGAERLHLWVAALVNIAEDHMERHKTREAYAAAKAKIFGNQTESDRAVYNLDDPWVRQIGDAVPSIKLGVSERETPAFGVWAAEEGVRARLPKDLGGLDTLLIKWDEVAPSLRVQRPSLLAGTATALAAEADPTAVAQVLRSFPGLPHRMEHVAVIDGVTYINDSKATNPLATSNAINQAGGPVVLIAGGLTKGINLDPLIEPFSKLRGLVLIGRDAPKLAEVAERAKVPTVRGAKSLESAVDIAREIAQTGDWVVLSPCGASFDMFENFSTRGDLFKEYVHSLES